MSDENKDLKDIQASDPDIIEPVTDAAAGLSEAASIASEAVSPVEEAVSEAAPILEDPDEVPEIVPEVVSSAENEPAEAPASSATVRGSSVRPASGKEKKTTIGGQALIEGIMMVGPHRTCIAVRKADGSIYVEEIKKSASETFFEKVPFVRGCIRFFRQLVSGTAAIMKSAEISEEGAPEADSASKAKDKKTASTPSAAAESAKLIGDETEDPDGQVSDRPKTIAEVKAEQKALAKTKTSKLDEWATQHNDAVMVMAAVLGLAFSVVLFILLPRLIVDTILHFISAERSDSILLNVGLNFIEGIVRIVIFLLYLAFTSRIKDIARVWMYHGAEHKTIACYESGEDLTVENIRKCSRFHPRCGTAFLFIVVLVSILVFCVASVFVGVNVWWVNMLIRLALVPLVGGISYEILRLCGRHDQNPICKIFIRPGLWLQKLTTKEPTDSMIEVAIASMQAVIPENSNEDIW